MEMEIFLSSESLKQAKVTKVTKVWEWPLKL